MKLIRCHIENFGKLSDYDYQFKPGLNIINQPNGYGKSTFASFIKAMFYGLESTAKRTSSLTDRKKYFPWQGGMYGGNIEFETENKKYRIERFFGLKEQEDTFKLYDLSTNLESFDFTEKIGEEIFKINKEAYERSTYVPGQNIQIKMNDSLNAKLGNILEGENDVNTSEIAIKNLDEAIKVYKRTGERGLIFENKDKILELERKIEKGKAEEKAIEERKIKLNETKQKISEYEKIKKQIQENLAEGLELESKKAKKQNYDLIIKKYQENLKSAEELKEFFKGEVPTDEELDILFDKCIQVEKYKVEVGSYELSEEEKENISELKNTFEFKNITEEIVNQKISNINEIKDVENKIENTKQSQDILEKNISNEKSKISSGKKLNIIFLSLTILAIIAGGLIFVLNLLNSFLAVSLIAVGIAFGIIYIVNKNKVSKSKKKYEEKQEEKQNLSEVLEGLENKRGGLEKEINEFLEEYLGKTQYEDKIIALTEIKASLSKYRELEEKINTMINKRSETNTKLALLQDSIKDYLEKYFEEVNEPYSKLAQEMKTKKNEFNRLTLSLEQSKMEKEEYERRNNVSELKEFPDKQENFNKQELEEKIRLLEAQLNSLNNEKLSNENQIERLESSIDELQETEAELADLKQKSEEDENKFEILKKTKNLLKQAKESFSSHYLNRMERGFEKYIGLIDKVGLEADIDVNLNVKLEQNGAKREVSYFSTGYQDLIYLCIRFSLIDALFEKESPFVVLDDPFVNLDEEKIKNCVELVNKIADRYQIIYFVCHDSRA